MKKKFLYSILVVGAVFSCVPDDRNNNMVDDSFGLTARDMVQHTSVHTGQLSVGIAKNGIGRSAASLSLTIQQEACQAALDAYNQKNRTNYKPIPSSLVNLDKAQLSFGADEVVKEVTLSWNVTDAAELIGEDTDYVIPVLVNSKELQVNPDRNLLLVNLIRSSVSVRQKSIARTVDETKVLPGPDGEQPELKESFILDIELDNPIKNVGITFPLVVDNSLIEVFNQDQDVPYVAAPEGLVTLDTPSAGISESDKSCTIRLTLDKGVLMEGDELPAFPNYLIPIRLDAQNASATYKGKNFNLQGLSFGNLVTYIGITYEEIKKGLVIVRQWGLYSDENGSWSRDISGFTAGADRNVTLDDDNIYIAETNQTKNLWAISLSDPTRYSKLPVGTVADEGTFYLSCPRVIKNTDASVNGGRDVLVVSNMVSGDPKLYVYANGTGEDPSVINMQTWASRRLGDTFTWWGSLQEGTLFFKDFNSAQGTVTFHMSGKTSGNMYLMGRIVAPAVTGAGAYFPFPDNINKGVCSSRGGSQAWLTEASKDLYTLEGADNAPTLTELSGYFTDTAFRFFDLGDKRYVAYTRQVSSSDGRLFVLEGTREQSYADIILERNVVYHAAIQNESEQDGIDETPSPMNSGNSGMDLDVRIKGNEAYIAVIKQNVGLSLFKMTYND